MCYVFAFYSQCLCIFYILVIHKNLDTTNGGIVQVLRAKQCTHDICVFDNSTHLHTHRHIYINWSEKNDISQR